MRSISLAPERVITGGVVSLGVTGGVGGRGGVGGGAIHEPPPHPHDVVDPVVVLVVSVGGATFFSGGAKNVTISSPSQILKNGFS